MNKVIFLDIDGVLNSNFRDNEYQQEISDGFLIDPDKIKLLSQLVGRTKSEIILHSGWRFWFDNKGNPICKESAKLVALLNDEGLRIAGMTPDLTTEEIRQTKKFSLVKAEEILLWLKTHHNISGWVVLDDLALHNESVARHQIMPDPAIGLTLEDIAKAESILEGTSKRLLQGKICSPV